MKFVNLSVILLALATAAASQSGIIPLFPSKDGTVSPDSCSGDQKELRADSAKQSVGWMLFKYRSIDFRDISSAMLMVYIKTVPKPGLCGIHQLMKKISVPENMVKSENVKFDDMPIAALPLDSSFSDQMILLNITELIQSKTFYGIAIRPMRGLSACFSSKEGFPPPVILITRDSVSTNPVKWWSANDVPDMSTGKPNDFYVRASQGVVYRKSAGAWDSVASLTIPPPPAVTPKKPVHRPSIKKR